MERIESEWQFVPRTCEDINTKRLDIEYWKLAGFLLNSQSPEPSYYDRAPRLNLTLTAWQFVLNILGPGMRDGD